MDYEQEIDLRPIVLAVLRRWYVLVAGAALAMIAAAFWYGRTPAVYQADAQVGIVRVQTTANFNSGIKRTDAALDPAVLDAALVKLATSGVVVQGTIDRLGNALPESLRNPGVLAGLMSAGADTTSNLLTLSVTHTDSAQATQISNAWLEAFVPEANRVYGAPRGAAVIETAQQQFEAARAEYEQREQALADFIAQDETSLLEGQIKEYQAVLDGLVNNRAALIQQTATYDAIHASALISTYASLRWSGQMAVVRELQQRQIQKLSDAYDTLRRLEQLRQELVALRDNLNAGGASASADLALSLLKARVFSANADLPASVQIQVPLTGQVSAADIDVLLGTIDARMKTVQDEIASQTATLLDPNSYDLPDPDQLPQGDADPGLQQQYLTLLSHNLLRQLLQGSGITETEQLVFTPDALLVQMQQRIQQLRATMLELGVKKFELEQERDLAKEKYQAFGRQLMELTSANIPSDEIVRAVSTAAGASQVSRSSPIARIGLIGIAVLVVLALLIVAAEFLPAWLRPVRRRQESVESRRPETQS